MRLKIILGNVLVLLLVTIGASFVVGSGLEEHRSERLDFETERAAPLLSRSYGYSALELVEAVRDRAETTAIRGIFTAIDPERRRERGLSAAGEVIRWFHDPARNRDGQPELVIITDRVGAVVARDSSVNLVPEGNLVTELPSLSDVLDTGAARHDVWGREDSGLLLEVGLAPIRGPEGGILGALIVGYDISDGIAGSQSTILGHDVAFLTERGLYSSSLEGAERSALESLLDAEAVRSALSAEGGVVSSASLDGRDVRLRVGSLPMATSTQLGYAILVDVERAGAPDSILGVLPILSALGILAIVVIGFMTAASFLRPLEEIEETLLLVMNGETEMRVDVESPELGGLAYRVNQLIDELTIDGDEEQRQSSDDDWQGVREDSQRISVPSRPPETDESEPTA